jgi:toxin ParE1/3/4
MLRDFGEVSVRYQDGTEEVVHFFASFEVLALNGSDAGRLRAGRSAGAGRRSRRGLRRHSLVVVFDRPRTVAVKRGTEWKAAKDLQTHRRLLSVSHADRAPELIARVYDAAAALRTFPNRGGSGKKEGTRELVLAPLPYFVVYTVRGEVVFSVRILHGAQAVAVGRRAGRTFRGSA